MPSAAGPARTSSASTTTDAVDPSVGTSLDFIIGLDHGQARIQVLDAGDDRFHTQSGIVSAINTPPARTIERTGCLATGR